MGQANTLKRAAMLSGLVIFVLIVSGCFPGEIRETGTSVPGFFRGVWHGWIAPLSLIVQLFDSDVRIYEPYNNGWWYDFGYYMAVISGFGGLSLARRRKSEHRD